MWNIQCWFIEDWYLWKFQILIPLLDQNLKFDNEIYIVIIDIFIFLFPLFKKIVISITQVLVLVLRKKYSTFICSRPSFFIYFCLVLLRHGCFVGVHFQYHLHKMNSFFFLCLKKKSDLGYVDSTFNNLSESIDFLHVCKMLIVLFIYIYIYIYIYISISVGYTLFSFNQDIVRFDLMSKIVHHNVNKIQISRM
jgi:hypothetical protein